MRVRPASRSANAFSSVRSAPLVVSNILHAADTGEHGHETFDVAAKKRFAAGEPDFITPSHEKLRQRAISQEQ